MLRRCDHSVLASARRRRLGAPPATPTTVYPRCHAHRPAARVTQDVSGGRTVRSTVSAPDASSGDARFESRTVHHPSAAAGARHHRSPPPSARARRLRPRARPPYRPDGAARCLASGLLGRSDRAVRDVAEAGSGDQPGGAEGSNDRHTWHGGGGGRAAPGEHMGPPATTGAKRRPVARALPAPDPARVDARLHPRLRRGGHGRLPRRLPQRSRAAATAAPRRGIDATAVARGPHGYPARPGTPRSVPSGARTRRGASVNRSAALANTTCAA